MIPDPLRALVRASLRLMSAYDVPRPPNVRVKLDANEAPHPLPPAVAEELGRALARTALHRYPRADAGGLRQLVADELGVAPEQLAFGNGSDELIALLIAAFGEPRPGAASARVLYPTPSFVVYRIATLGAGAEPIEVPLNDDFQLGELALMEAMREHRPNLAFFARPNNPTGTLWERSVLERALLEFSDTLIVADEAYIAYGGDSFLPQLAQHENLVVLRTLSKIGLASLRVGFLVANPGIVAEVEKVRPPYNVGGLNLAAAELLLRDHGELLRSRAAEVVRERERLRRALAVLPGVRVFDSAANLLLIRVADAPAVWAGLAARGVLVRKFGDHGPLATCLRVTVGAPEENDIFVAAMHEILGG